MNRRTYVVTAGSTASALLAGCVSSADTTDETENASNGTDDTGGASSDDDPDTSDGTDEDTQKSDPIDAVTAYVEAGKDADLEATINAVHEESPLLTFLEEGETDFDDGIEDVEIADYETVEKDVSAADVLDLQHAETLFQDEDELTNTLDEENAVLLEVWWDPEDSLREDLWVIVTEEDDWKVLWATTQPPAEPAEQLEPEVFDENNAVVAEVDWEPDIDMSGEWARVTLTEDPKVEADAVRIESTIAESEFELSGDSQSSWAGSWTNVPLNSSGDQIVVTVITNTGETVIHRVHYEP